MPIFEYKCVNCGKKVEFLETAAGKRARHCPHCGSSKLEKQFSTFSPRVKEGSSKRCFSCSDRTCPHAGNQKETE